MDVHSVTTEFETNFLTCHPSKGSKITIILARNQAFNRDPKHWLKAYSDAKSTLSTSSDMNWVHALATANTMYTIGT